MAEGSATLGAGRQKTLVLALNHAGSSLLKRFHRITAAYLIRRGAVTLARGKLSFTAPTDKAKHRPKK